MELARPFTQVPKKLEIRKFHLNIAQAYKFAIIWIYAEDVMNACVNSWCSLTKGTWITCNQQDRVVMCLTCCTATSKIFLRLISANNFFWWYGFYALSLIQNRSDSFQVLKFNNALVFCKQSGRRKHSTKTTPQGRLGSK